MKNTVFSLINSTLKGDEDSYSILKDFVFEKTGKKLTKTSSADSLAETLVLFELIDIRSKNPLLEIKIFINKFFPSWKIQNASNLSLRCCYYRKAKQWDIQIYKYDINDYEIYASGFDKIIDKTSLEHTIISIMFLINMIKLERKFL